LSCAEFAPRASGQFRFKARAGSAGRRLELPAFKFLEKLVFSGFSGKILF
jgi:hypothetical protein